MRTLESAFLCLKTSQAPDERLEIFLDIHQVLIHEKKLRPRSE
jgi:hypothetical protein